MSRQTPSLPLEGGGAGGSGGAPATSRSPDSSSAAPGEHEVDLLVDVRRDRGPCVAGEVLGSVAESGNCGDGGLLGLALPVGVLQVAQVGVDLGGGRIDVASHHWLQALQPGRVDLNRTVP